MGVTGYTHDYSRKVAVLWKSTGLTNDWGGIDKIATIAKEVVVETAKMVATMIAVEIATPIITRVLGAEVVPAVTTAARSEPAVTVAVSDVRQAALNRTSAEVASSQASSTRPPTATAAVKDTKTGQIYTDVSGRRYPKLQEPLNSNAHNPSRGAWKPVTVPKLKQPIKQLQRGRS